MADFKLSRLKYTWRGIWTSGTVYYNDDIIRVGGRVYVCIAPHTADTNFYDDLNFLNDEVPPSIEPRWEVMIESVSWSGMWVENTYYNRGDVVNIYLCRRTHVGIIGY
jgi:hypothetical protein